MFILTKRYSYTIIGQFSYLRRQLSNLERSLSPHRSTHQPHRPLYLESRTLFQPTPYSSEKASLVCQLHLSWILILAAASSNTGFHLPSCQLQVFALPPSEVSLPSTPSTPSSPSITSTSNSFLSIPLPILFFSPTTIYPPPTQPIAEDNTSFHESNAEPKAVKVKDHSRDQAQR